MNNMSEIAIATAAIAAAISSSAMAQTTSSPAEVTVGIIDVRANELTFPDKGTWIDYRQFSDEGKFPAEWITEAGVDHGQMMASAFVRQIRQIDPAVKIKILAANAFQENTGSTGSSLYSRENSSRKLSVTWAGARRALDWFKERGVKVILTAFNGNDSVQLRAFMKTAQDYGMTVFASAGNKVGGPVYPAAYPQAISVAGDNKDLTFRNDLSISRWVDFVMDGSVPLAKSGRAADEGSSFASAKAAALGAYYSAGHPDATRDDIEAAIRISSQQRSYNVQNSSVTVSYLDENASANAIRTAKPQRAIASGSNEAVGGISIAELAKARTTSTAAR